MGEENKKRFRKKKCLKWPVPFGIKGIMLIKKSLLNLLITQEKGNKCKYTV
jgi:hypothetical protein